MTGYHVGQKVQLHRSPIAEAARVSAVHTRETGTELVLRTVDPNGGQGQVVNVFAPFEGTSWVTPAGQPAQLSAGAA